MIKEIEIMHGKINHDELIKVKLISGDYHGIDTSDLIHITKTGMLRIVRSSGKMVTINPDFIVSAFIISKGMFL